MKMSFDASEWKLSFFASLQMSKIKSLFSKIKGGTFASLRFPRSSLVIRVNLLNP